MSKTKFTPAMRVLSVGPLVDGSIKVVGWARSDTGQNVEQVTLCSVEGKDWIADDEMRANADLWASAPDLYATLKAAKSLLDSMNPSGQACDCVVCRMSETALAKATGGAE